MTVTEVTHEQKVTLFVNMIEKATNKISITKFTLFMSRNSKKPKSLKGKSKGSDYKGWGR